MRLSSWLLWGAAALAVASPEDDKKTKDATYFNGKKVPPLLEITQDTWEKERKASRFLLVKHFSPWCPHCQDFAPTFQTLYEFYYTSTPAGDAPKNVDFTSFYDFRFAEINCVAFNDLCSQHKVSSYPTTILYENGEPISTLKGDKAIDILSVMVEDALEKAKPGTRPAKLRLPKPGDKSAPQPVEDTTVTKHDEAKAAAVPNTNEHEPDLKKNELPTTGAPKVEEPKAEPKQEGVKKVDEPQKAIDLAPSTPEAKPDPTSKPYSSPSPTYIWEPPVPPIKKPSGPVNQQGASVPLTAEDFQRLVTLTQDPWFIKFYAPWCHHCKALAPTWEQLAKEMKGRLNIGEVNCDKEPRLCKDVRIKGYPTMLFFRGGERVEYQGLRGLGDLLQYAKRCIEVSNGVQDVDYDTFKALEEKEPVIFLYFYDHATTTEDFIALERLPMTIMSHARLVKTRDPRLYERFKISTWPRLLVSREGRPTYYPPLSPREMRDTRLLLDWMRSVWLPLVPELTAANAREIMDGKYVVMGILNREDESSFNTAIRELKTAANEWMDRQIQLFRMERQELRDAKQLRIEEAEDRGDERRLRDAKNIRINMNLSRRKEVVFCWVDGVFWQRWLRTTYGVDIKENGERVIINDADNRRYWDTTSTGNPIVPSRTSILETLTKITANPPKIKPKLTIGFIEKIFFDIRVSFRDHPYLSSGCVLGIAFGVLSWFRGRIRLPSLRRSGYLRLEEGAAAALGLGGGSGEKKD